MAGNTHRLYQTPRANSSSCCGTTFSANRTNATDTHPPYDHLFKLLLIGDPGVGKSSLILRFTEDNYTDNYLTTIVIDFKIKTVKLDEETVKLQVWDVVGGEQIKSIMPCYYRGARGIVVVYDVANQESFDHVSDWLIHIDQYANKDVSILLLGNKCDQTTDKVIEYSTAKDLADQWEITFMETSAKDGTNVEEAFITLTAIIKNKVLNGLKQ